MASCLGPKSKKAVFAELLAGTLRMLVAIILTCSFLVLFGRQAFPRADFVGFPRLLGLLLIISPLWFGFYEMSWRMVTPPFHWSVRVLLASLITAAFSVWVLPDLLRWFFAKVFRFFDSVAF